MSLIHCDVRIWAWLNVLLLSCIINLLKNKDIDLESRLLLNKFSVFCFNQYNKLTHVSPVPVKMELLAVWMVYNTSVFVL